MISITKNFMLDYSLRDCQNPNLYFNDTCNQISLHARNMSLKYEFGYRLSMINTLRGIFKWASRKRNLFEGTTFTKFHCIKMPNRPLKEADWVQFRGLRFSLIILMGLIWNQDIVVCYIFVEENIKCNKKGVPSPKTSEMIHKPITQE